MSTYSKQTWDTTSIFNPTRMNHIEQGIYDASTNFKTVQKSISSFTVAANSYKDVDFNIEETGFTPLGIIQWGIFGTWSIVTIFANIQNSSVGRIRVRNVDNQEITTSGGSATILYVKS